LNETASVLVELISNARKEKMGMVMHIDVAEASNLIEMGSGRHVLPLAK
jgi:hypothetical protein